MSHSNEFGTLFRKMRNIERSESERKKSYIKLQNKINNKKNHFFPIILSGILVVTIISFLVLFSINSNSFNEYNSGSSGSEEVTFIGTGESWIVEYILTYPDSNTEKGVYKLTYIGEAERPFSIDYKIGTSSGENFQINNNYVTLGTTEKNGELIYIPEEIEATIYWNDDFEEILLKEK